MNYLRRHLRDIPEEHRASALEFLARVMEDNETPRCDADEMEFVDVDQIARDARMIQQELKHR